MLSLVSAKRGRSITDPSECECIVSPRGLTNFNQRLKSIVLMIKLVLALGVLALPNVLLTGEPALPML